VTQSNRKNDGHTMKEDLPFSDRILTLGDASPDGKSAASMPKSDLGAFGSAGAARYDVDVRRMPRRYKTAHRLQNKLIIDAALALGASHPVVVDLGCGTANDGLEILSRTSSALYVGVDHSPYMLRQAVRKLSRHGFEKRAVFLEEDFRFLDPRGFAKAIRMHQPNGTIAGVVSSMALHHYELPEKYHVYKFAYQLLPRGALFIITDLFSNAIERCAGVAIQKEIEDIRKIAARSRDAGKNGALTESHYIEENRPVILARELEGLREVGFSNIDLLFRHGQLGTLVAQKN
jgi:SAM-dependent methyltransferase